MEIGDGMGPGSSVATNKLLQVCWRRQVCIGSFQWPRWSREAVTMLLPGRQLCAEVRWPSHLYAGMSKQHTACTLISSPCCRLPSFMVGR